MHVFFFVSTIISNNEPSPSQHIHRLYMTIPCLCVHTQAHEVGTASLLLDIMLCDFPSKGEGGGTDKTLSSNYYYF